MESATRSIFKQTAAAAARPEPFSREIETPTFLPTYESNVKVPMFQSVLSGLFAAPLPAAAAGVVAYGLMDANWKGVILAGMAGFTATFFGVTWWQWVKRSDYFNSMLWRLETIIGADIDSDGDTGRPAPSPVKVEIREGPRWQFAELPGEPHALHKLACAVLAGETFSERTATAAGYTQEEWGNLRDEFINRGLAHWNHPTRKQQGVSLGRSGKQVLQAIADSPLPQED